MTTIVEDYLEQGGELVEQGKQAKENLDETLDTINETAEKVNQTKEDVLQAKDEASSTLKEFLHIEELSIDGIKKGFEEDPVAVGFPLVAVILVAFIALRLYVKLKLALMKIVFFLILSVVVILLISRYVM